MTTRRSHVVCTICPWAGVRAVVSSVPCPKCAALVKRRSAQADRRAERAKAEIAAMAPKGQP